MQQNNVPITPSCAFGKGFKVTAAQTDQTGATGANIVTGYTFNAAGAPPTTVSGGGGQCLGFRVRVPVTSAAAIVQLFRNTGGTRTQLGAPIVVTAIIVSNTVGGFDSGYIPLPPALFAAGDKIDALSTIAQETHIDLNLAEY